MKKLVLTMGLFLCVSLVASAQQQKTTTEPGSRSQAAKKATTATTAAKAANDKYKAETVESAREAEALAAPEKKPAATAKKAKKS